MAAAETTTTTTRPGSAEQQRDPMTSMSREQDDGGIQATDTTPLTVADRERESNGADVREAADASQVELDGQSASLSPLLPSSASPGLTAAAACPRLSLWLPLACLLLALCALSAWLLQQQAQYSPVAPAAPSRAFRSDGVAHEPDAASPSPLAARSAASSAALFASPSAGSPFASFLSSLQHPSSCSESSRVLLYPCLSAAVELEHGSELYGGQSPAFLYSAVRAALTAAASHRRLMLDRHGCDALSASRPSGNGTSPEWSHALLCCSWDRYLAPLHSCPHPSPSLGHSGAVGSAFSVAPVAVYSARQQCLGQEELWAALRSDWPAASQLSVVQAVASQLLRPASAFASHLLALLPLLPSPSDPTLLLHVPTRAAIDAVPGERGRSGHRQARSQTLSSYLSVLRYHAASVPASSAAAAGLSASRSCRR